MIDEKEMKKFLDLCTKISTVFSDLYVTKTGYIMSLDIEKPFVIQLKENDIDYFTGLYGDFKLIHIPQLRNFKAQFISKSTELTTNRKGEEVEKIVKTIVIPEPKDLQYINHVTSNTEYKLVTDRLNVLCNRYASIDKWEKFVLSDDVDENDELINYIFNRNQYLDFKPKDNEDFPSIIFTKSLLPLVTEKNYDKLYYSSCKVNETVYMMVFLFNFTMFDVYMFHTYIAINKDNI